MKRIRHHMGYLMRYTDILLVIFGRKFDETDMVPIHCDHGRIQHRNSGGISRYDLSDKNLVRIYAKQFEAVAHQYSLSSKHVGAVCLIIECSTKIAANR
jgi:hypothetical protein